mmetsp:Transcript_33316/g.99196  ORF Transcript_33316/g.99196 Transcript_33316/m.99196 type:complete len:316 (-) Transcript_33316:333-1280(-)
MSGKKPPTGGGVPAGAFGWATVHEFGDKDSGKPKCVCLSGDVLYTGSGTDGVKRWSAATGGNDILLPASLFSDPVHAITVVGDNVWVCTGNNANAGTIVVYDINTKALKTKGFAAHKGEVTCMAPGPGGNYVITGGVDFQVKLWTPDGSPLMTSNHHNKQVDCILVTPSKAGGNTDSGGVVWTGSTDGTVYCWSDDDGRGKADVSKGKSISIPGNKQVKSMAYLDGHVWVGCDGGQVCVISVATSKVVKTLKPHGETVDALAAVGNQMWSGSRDKVKELEAARAAAEARATDLEAQLAAARRERDAADAAAAATA